MSCARRIRRGGILLSILAVAGSVAPVAAKLVAPVEIALRPLLPGRRDPPGIRRLRVEVTPRVDAPRVEVTVTLPPGVTLVRGDLRWAEPARDRQTQSRDLVLKVPPRGERRLVAIARLTAPKALPQSRTASYTYNPRLDAGPPAGAIRMPLPTPAPGRTIRRSE